VKYLLILNPGSRAGRGRKRWKFWTEGMKRAGADFEPVVTRDLGHARQLATEAPGFDVVVAVGGDGTINAVLAGLADAPAAERRMGVLYAGTSPDFCRFHSIPTDPAAALQVLLDGLATKVDVASIGFQNAGGPATSWFGCGCNIGLGAKTADIANRLRRFTGDTAGTAMALLCAIATVRRFDAEILLDGRRMELRGVNHVAVLKNPWIASGLRLSVDRSPDDGLLTVVTVSGRSRTGMLALLPAFYAGSAVNAEGVFTGSCRRFSMRTERPVSVEFDGDSHGGLPVSIELHARRLDLICGTRGPASPEGTAP